ncbi:MAG: Gfo/Idh/MocA family oxidoreductase [Bacteroidota bacterium]
MKKSRRSFIKTSGLALGTLSFSNASSWSSILVPQQPKSLGVALVGLGYYSRDLLAPALQRTRHCKLTGIVTGSPQKIPVWQRRYGIKDQNVYNYQNISDIANNPDIDVIYIVLPTGLHAEYAIKAAETGKHVWCEKPMARTEAECESIIEACAKNKVKLSIGYRMQHEPNTQRIIGWAGTKPYGKILNLTSKAAYLDSRTNHWKLKEEMGGGAIYDMGVYPINALRYASGMEPTKVVKAKHETTRPAIYKEVDETTYFTLEFPGGVIGEGATSFGEFWNELRVNGENGWYELKPFQSYSGIKGTTSDGKSLNQNIPNQQAKQMDDDALAIIDKKRILVPGEEGLRDIRIVQAIKESAVSGQSILI